MLGMSFIIGAGISSLLTMMPEEDKPETPEAPKLPRRTVGDILEKIKDERDETCLGRTKKGKR